MIKFKSIYKGIIKFPVSSGLNILSLIIAFSGIITLILYVNYQNSFDTFNKNFKNIYQVRLDQTMMFMPAKTAGLIKKDVPGIENVSRLKFIEKQATTEALKNENRNYKVQNLYADNSIFSIFTLPFLNGNKTDALTRPNTIVLTKALSSKLFDTKNPVGKIVWLNEEKYTVTGVIQNIPQNSSFEADCITSFSTLTQDPNSAANRWNEWSYNIFCTVSPRANIHNLAQQINQIPALHKHFVEQAKMKVTLNPLSSLHFTKTTFNQFDNVSRTVLNILVLLTIILAAMGIINFVNLSVSQAGEKAKRYSIMRVLGAGRGIHTDFSYCTGFCFCSSFYYLSTHSKPV